MIRLSGVTMAQSGRSPHSPDRSRGPLIHPAIAADIDGKQVAQFRADIQYTVGNDGRRVELVPGAEEGRLLVPPLVIDAGQATVVRTDPGVAVAIRHRCGIAQRVADAGRRPDLLASGRVETVQVAVAAVDAERILRNETTGRGHGCQWYTPRAIWASRPLPPRPLGGPGIGGDAAAGVDRRRVAKRNGLLFRRQFFRKRPDQAVGRRGFGPGGRLGPGGNGRARGRGRAAGQDENVRAAAGPHPTDPADPTADEDVQRRHHGFRGRLRRRRRGCGKRLGGKACGGRSAAACCPLARRPDGRGGVGGCEGRCRDSCDSVGGVARGGDGRLAVFGGGGKAILAAGPPGVPPAPQTLPQMRRCSGQRSRASWWRTRGGRRPARCHPCGERRGVCGSFKRC